MLERIVIKLAGPICNCKQQDLGWGITIIDGRFTLTIKCNQCQQRLVIAPADFKASFELKEKYPETKPTTPAVIKDGTLIDASKRFLQ